MTDVPFKFPSRIKGRWEYLIVHCFYTPPDMDVGADWVDQLHRGMGWRGCGYHICIRRDGTIEWEGTGHPTRPLNSTGSHVGGCGPGWNARCLGVSMAGGMSADKKRPEDNFTGPQLASLRLVIEAAKHGLDIPPEKIIGHRDLIKMTNAAPKACPCFSVQAWMGGWKQDIKGYEEKRRRLPFKWLRNIFPLNRSDPLRVPTRYTVRKGDTLYGISKTYGVRLDDIRRLNPQVTSDLIEVGQRLRLLG